VSLVFDDVVQENPILKGFPLFDLERIEVLRGPQGTLFGRNSPAGVVKFESAKPGNRFEGYAAGLGRTAWSTPRAVNVPLARRGAARVAQSQNRDDWVTNTAPAAPRASSRATTTTPRACSCCSRPSRPQRAAQRARRDLKGSARLFRANIIKPGTNDLVDGFDESKSSAPTASTARTSAPPAAACACAGTWAAWR
jgi:iron complex outermembrane recepter protein